MLKSQKNKLVQIFNSKLFLAVSLVIFFLMTYATIQEIRKRNAIGREIQGLRDEIQALENQNVELSKLLEYVKTDTYAELEARAKLGRSLPGEKVVVIPPEERGGVSIQESERRRRGEEDYMIPIEIDRTQYTSAQKWWLYFFAPKYK